MELVVRITGETAKRTVLGSLGAKELQKSTYMHEENQQVEVQNITPNKNGLVDFM